MAKTEKGSARAETRQLPRDQWKTTFDGFTRRYLATDQPEAATIELLSPTLGDQVEVEGVRLLGVVFDPKSNLFELDLEDVEHLVFETVEIWVIEAEDGFVSTLEVVQGDGTKEIIYLRKSDPIASGTEPPAPHP